MLEILQLALLASTGIFSAISSPRFAVHQAFNGFSIPLDFQTVTIAYPDLTAAALILVSGLRVFAERDYRLHLHETFSTLLRLPHTALFAIFLIVMSSGILWAKQPSLLIASVAHFAICLLVSLISADLVRMHGNGILWAILVGGAIQAVVGIGQVLQNDTLGLSAFGEVPRPYYEPTNFFRASGLSMHSNYLGGYLMLAIFAALCLVWQAQTPIRRALIIGLGISCAVGMIGTLSRSALLSAAIAMSPLLWLAWRRLNTQARRNSLLLMSACGIGAVAFALFAVRGDVMTRFLGGREFFFDDSWAVIQGAPLLGVGAGNLMYEVWLNVGNAPRPVLPVHNVYLYIWAETGILGLAVFGATLGLNLWQLRRPANAAHLIVGCGVLALAVVSLFDNYPWAVHPHRVLTFWWFGIWWGMAWQSKADSSLRGASSP